MSDEERDRLALCIGRLSMIEWQCEGARLRSVGWLAEGMQEQVVLMGAITELGEPAGMAQMVPLHSVVAIHDLTAKFGILGADAEWTGL